MRKLMVEVTIDPNPVNPRPAPDYWALRTTSGVSLMLPGGDVSEITLPDVWQVGDVVLCEGDTYVHVGANANSVGLDMFVWSKVTPSGAMADIDYYLALPSADYILIARGGQPVTS